MGRGIREDMVRAARLALRESEGNDAATAGDLATFERIVSGATGVEPPSSMTP